MANFLYNGVELPALPEYDKSIYPYAYIADVSEMAEYLPSDFTGYMLWLSSCRAEVNDGGAILQEIKVGDKNHTLYSTASSWVTLIEAVEESSYANLIRPANAQDAFFWANTDVLNSNGSVYFAASTPIRVDSKLKISVGGGSANGDGFALYNGVKLPKLPEWDKAAYPYACILYADMSEYLGEPCWYTTFYAFNSIVKRGFAPDGITPTIAFNAGTSYISYGCTDSQTIVDAFAEFFPLGLNEWVFGLSESSEFNGDIVNIFGDDFIWANFDVTNVNDSTTFLAASDPIPLDGYTVIEWDGNTEGLESIVDVWFKVAPFADASAAIAVWNNAVAADFERNAVSDAAVWVVAPIGVGVSPAIASNVGYDEDFGTVIDGIYALKDVDTGEYTSLIAYKATPSDGGEVTATTATVEFTCTDLENTEPTDSICAWVYKKSDGLNTTIPPTWTSERFSAPAYSTTYTFTGLTPNTEYEVYGCIFVNGEATDHNAIAEFTTLEGSGDIKPVYKRVDGTWVKKTAYERQKGEWVLISTADS